MLTLNSSSTQTSSPPWSPSALLPVISAHQLTDPRNSVSANESTGTWTIPTVKFPDGTYLMDSRKIVERVEKEHPEPSIHLDSPTLAKLEEIMPRIMGPLRPIYFTTVPERLLNEERVPYWQETRSKLAGMPLDQLNREKGGQVAWNAAKPIKTPSYADFVWAGFLIFMQRNQVIDDLYNVSGDSQLHKDLLEATAPWHKRNDH